MKKTLLMGAAICAVFAMTSCKSKESAYKKAYEKAKAQQETVVTTTPVTTQPTTPVAVTPTAPVTTTPAADYSNVTVRTENVSLVNGAPLKAYSVVIGSFSVQSNATALSTTLAGKGYTPRVVKAAVTIQRLRLLRAVLPLRVSILALGCYTRSDKASLLLLISGKSTFHRLRGPSNRVSCDGPFENHSWRSDYSRNATGNEILKGIPEKGIC